MRDEMPFKPGGAYRYLDLGENIENSPPALIAYCAIAGNWRAREYLGRDAGIPTAQPKAVSAEIECAKCGKVKPRKAFAKDTRKRNGLASYCRECERGRVKVYRLRRARSW